MIYAALNGGLGNQMFQYAAARALAVKLETTLMLDVIPLYSKLQLSSLATYRKYELHIFPIQAKTNDLLFKHKYLYPFAKAQYFLNAQLNRLTYNYYKETDFAYHPQFETLTDNTYLDGHFQSERYFKSIEQIIRNEFRFVQPLNTENQSWLNKINQCNAVSVHVRRGDYVRLSKNMEKHGVTPLDYFIKAAEYIEGKIDNPVYYVFSDDPDWARQHLNFLQNMYLVDNNQSVETAYVDMQLMSACKHNIICNSTFSWWGAWLNNHKEKIVIAPEKWFNNPTINSKDIYPPEWIKL